jgi:alcohol dehydrogenase (NADP+)
MLHWPEAWVYQGRLERLAEQAIETAEALTFPEDASGDPVRAGLSLSESWANLETAVNRGLTRTLGVCNVSIDQLRTILDEGAIPPAIVQVERHPYQPRTDLVEFCHNRGIRVVAHSPLSAPGLLTEPVLEDIASDRGWSPAQVVLAWNVSEGVVPIPSSTDPEHIVDNLAAAGLELDATEYQRIAMIEDTAFER